MCYFVIEEDFPDIDFLSCFGQCQELIETPAVNTVDKLVNEFKCTFSARAIERALERCGEYHQIQLQTPDRKRKLIYGQCKLDYVFGCTAQTSSCKTLAIVSSPFLFVRALYALRDKNVCFQQ